MSFVPNIDDVEFVKEVPAKGNPFGETKWLPVLEAIKSAPNTPAVVFRPHPDQPANVNDNNAVKVANNLRTVTKKRGKWDVSTRKAVVYLTYLGEN